MPEHIAKIARDNYLSVLMQEVSGVFHTLQLNNFQIKDPSSALWYDVHQLTTELEQLLSPREKERFYNNQTGKKKQVVHSELQQSRTWRSVKRMK